MQRDPPPHRGRDLSDEEGSVHLDATTIEAIASRVAEILSGPLDGTGSLISAGDVAKRLGVSRTWVYENADRLGAVRLGGGARSRLRFDPARVAEALGGVAEAAERRARPSPQTTKWLDTRDLIPIRGPLSRSR